MRITVVGGGRIGTSLIRGLVAEKHEITLIDSDEKVVETVGSLHDIIGYVGNGAAYSVLESAGVRGTDLLIAVTANDEINMLACLTAHKLGVAQTVARVRSPEYVEHMYLLKDDLSLSMTINPEYAVAEEIARVLRFPSATHVELFAEGKVEMVTFTVTEENPLCGALLSQLPQKIGTSVLVCAVDRGGEIVIPSGSFRISANDTVYLAGAPADVSATFRKVGLSQNPVRTVMLAGGGNISYYLAERLLHEHVHVKIVEENEKRCEELAEALPGAVILHASVSEHEVLLEEGLPKTDAFVALTGLDEANILASLYADRQKVRKVIGKVESGSLAALAKDSGVSVISPKQVTENQILRFVRSMADRVPETSVLSLYKLADGQAEMYEFALEDEIPGLCDIPLMKLKLRPGVLVACVVRSGKIIIPHGTDVMKKGDRVLVVSAEQILSELTDVLAVEP